MTSRQIFTRFTLATAIALLASGAWAQQEGSRNSQDQPRQSRAFKILDTDGNGKITLEEIAAEQKRLLAAADVDGDGKLSVTEFRRRGRMFMSLRATSLFDLLDVNGDQMVTLEEIGNPSARWIKRYDANADGLTPDELPRRKRFGKGKKRR